MDPEEDGFERWLEAFEERAQLAGWSSEHKLYQLKLHLEDTALQVFRMIPEDSKKEYGTVKEHFKRCFRCVDIEELKGMEFHQKTQGSETIEQLGLCLQS